VWLRASLAADIEGGGGAGPAAGGGVRGLVVRVRVHAREQLALRDGNAGGAGCGRLTHVTGGSCISIAVAGGNIVLVLLIHSTQIYNAVQTTRISWNRAFLVRVKSVGPIGWCI
jgi:hypothetical protein